MTIITTPNLDDLLLDVATAIELSDRDRRIAENRYRRLKKHLERPESPLAPYLIYDEESRIYPQGSMAIGTTVVSGTKEDRFDLDALVEMNVPPEWTPKQVLDLLYESLKDFPDVIKVERCTRCVQLQFAYMHMDVTVMDPAARPRVERVGEIFHSPDEGGSERVPANPYGFSGWFRTSVHRGSEQFVKVLNERRQRNGVNRLAEVVQLEAAQQDDLPPVLPPRLDSEQAVALKLLKRYLCVAYEERNIKRPPSIYLSKLAVDVGASPYGLTSQLAALAQHIEEEMRHNIVANTTPDERNPTYPEDRLNDRWPQTVEDMEVLAKDMGVLCKALESARNSEFAEINKIFAVLFGERVSKRSAEALLERAAEKENYQTHYEKGTGAVVLAAGVTAPAVVKALSREPQHHFHCGGLPSKDS